MFILPFSPRWLAKQGRTQEARDTLVRLHGGRKNADLLAVEAEIQEMIMQIEWGRSKTSTLDILQVTDFVWQSGKTFPPIFEISLTRSRICIGPFVAVWSRVCQLQCLYPLTDCYPAMCQWTGVNGECFSIFAHSWAPIEPAFYSQQLLWTHYLQRSWLWCMLSRVGRNHPLIATRVPPR